MGLLRTRFELHLPGRRAHELSGLVRARGGSWWRPGPYFRVRGEILVFRVISRSRYDTSPSARCRIVDSAAGTTLTGTLRWTVQVLGLAATMVAGAISLLGAAGRAQDGDAVGTILIGLVAVVLVAATVLQARAWSATRVVDADEIRAAMIAVLGRHRG